MNLYKWKCEEKYQVNIQQVVKNFTEEIQIYTEEFFTTSERISNQQSLNNQKKISLVNCFKFF